MPEIKNRINFTEESISKLPPAEAGKRDYYHDTKVHGLVVSVTDKGSKTYYVYKKIDGRPVKNKLGKYPDMKVPLARQKADLVRGAIAGGKNPHADKRKYRANIALNSYLSCIWSVTASPIRNHGNMMKEKYRDF